MFIYAQIFEKNERRACDHRAWPKSGATANFEFSDFQVESTGFLGLGVRLTLPSNQAGELAVTREPRLGDRKLVFCFSKRV